MIRESIWLPSLRRAPAHALGEGPPTSTPLTMFTRSVAQVFAARPRSTHLLLLPPSNLCISYSPQHRKTARSTISFVGNRPIPCAPPSLWAGAWR